jgi:hypothetical protein
VDCEERRKELEAHIEERIEKLASKARKEERNWDGQRRKRKDLEVGCEEKREEMEAESEEKKRGAKNCQ